MHNQEAIKHILRNNRDLDPNQKKIIRAIGSLDLLSGFRDDTPVGFEDLQMVRLCLRASFIEYQSPVEFENLLKKAIGDGTPIETHSSPTFPDNYTAIIGPHGGDVRLRAYLP